MKRSTKLTGLFVSIVFCVLLFSCKNFFNNESFLNELENAIKYVNTDPFTVRFSTEGGKISPSGDYSVKPGDIIQLIFNPESDKCFINWEVFAGDTLLSVEELSSYIHFDNLDEIETSIQILKKADNLKIQAKTVTRPNIVSATPLYDDEGAYRDRRITIMFDQYLDRDSIYFTKEELIEAGVWDSAANCVKSGYTLLDKNGDKKYFGYQKTGDDNSIVWKVATITKRTDKSANLLKCYECPEFDMYDTSVLRILSKTEVLQMPPVNADILVNIKTNFGVQEKSVTGAKKLVSLNSAYAWSYLTNSEYDNKAPIITELILYTVKPGDKDYTTIKNNEKLYLRDNDNEVNNIDIKTLIEKDPVKVENNYLKYNLSEGKMWIKAQVNDIGSGVKSLKGEITKVDTALYPCKEEKKIPYVAYTAKLNAVGPNSFVHSTDDNGEFFDVSGLQEEGLYRLTFTATDNNEKDCTEETYFFYDGTAPKLLPKENIFNLRTAVSTESVSWSQNPTGVGAEDFDHIEVECWDTEKNERIGDIKKQDNLDTKTFSFTGLTEKKPYEYRFYSVDYSGNRSSEYTVYKDNIPSTKNATSITNSRTSYDKETLNWTNPGADVDYLIIERCFNGEVKDTFTQNVENKETTKTFEELTNQEKYEYRFYTVDYSGNKSNYKPYVDNTGPEVRPIVYIGTFNEGIRLFVKAPNDDEYDHISVTGAFTQDYSLSKGEHVVEKFTGKTKGYSYIYYVSAVDFSGNKSTVTVTETAGIKPGYYCYLIDNKDIFVSENMLNDGQGLVGIVISDSVDSKTNIETAKIMRITVDENKSVVYNQPNTAVYNGTYGAGVDNQTDHGEIFYQSIVNNNKLEYFPKIKHLYYDVNNKDTNKIIWYLPGLNEILPLNGYWSGPKATINASLSKIPSNIEHMGWLGDGMSEMVSCTFNNDDSSTPKFSVVYFNRADYSYYKLKSYSTHATNSLLMARINPAY